MKTPAKRPLPMQADHRPGASGRRRRTLLRLAGVFAAAAAWGPTALAQSPSTAPAQGFPARPVRIISPYPPGITPDIALRLLAKKLSRIWNQQVLVDARTGGNGFIAVGALKQAPADGYTLLFVGNAHLAINPTLLKSVPYNAQADFAPVSTLYQAPFFLGVSTSGLYRNVRDLVAGAAANPGKVFYSTPYVGSPPHFGGAALAHFSNTRMVPVHYKDGPQMYTAVATGEVAFSVATIRSFQPLVDAGKLKVIAVAAPARLAAYPDVPTVEESGGPKGMDITTWTGVVAPRGTPAEIVQRVSADVTRALADADLRQRYRDDGIDAWASTPGAMTELIRSETRVYEKAIQAYGVQAE
jgi:tripartite-type tricarboxylate transporter receptor subunit TctC